MRPGLIRECIECKPGSPAIPLRPVPKRVFIYLMLLHLLFPAMARAQDISIRNPSLEGIPHVNAVPAGWIKCGASPDLHPGACCGVTLPASDGKTYMGCLSSVDWSEGISTALGTKLKKGSLYTISFDMAFPGLYYNQAVSTGTLVIYGSNAPGTMGDELWRSPSFYHKEWRRYTIVFKPEKDYTYLSFWSYFDRCTDCKLSGVLLDNISAEIREVPQVEIVARNSCRGTGDGVARVVVKEGVRPYRFLWSPGNYTDSAVSNLNPGKYQVTVTSANGTNSTSTVIIDAYDIKGTVNVLEPECFGDKNGQLIFKGREGIAPYKFSIDGGRSFSEDSVFADLPAGAYNAVIRDNANCSLNMIDVKISQPDELKIQDVVSKPVSCSSVKDGQLTFVISGGTHPYTYEVAGVGAKQDSIVNGLDEGNYGYVVRDINNCQVSGNSDITKEYRDCAVFMPNAFSPNGDGLNDIFRAKVHDAVTDFRLAVYGRWGQLVFETNNPQMGWDGSQKGQGLPSGSYLWVCTYTDSKLQPMKQTGTLVMVR